MTNIEDIPRNDLAAAERYYEERGRLHPDEVEILAMLQDDPEEFFELSRDWTVTTERRSEVPDAASIASWEASAPATDFEIVDGKPVAVALRHPRSVRLIVVE
jgi:hypothetical protein